MKVVGYARTASSKGKGQTAIETQLRLGEQECAEKGAKMKVVGYARIASDKRNDETGLEAQVLLIEQKCAEKGYELVAVYSDEGVSGTTLLESRPQGALLMRSAQKSEFQAVLICNSDRIGRTSYVSEKAIHDLHDELGILILAVDDSTDVTTHAGRFMFSIRSVVAELEKCLAAKRSERGSQLPSPDEISMG